MKRILTCVFVAAAAVAATVGVKAATTTYAINVGEFSKLKVTNDIDVRYVCNPDSAGYAVFTAEDKYADAFLFSNKGGTLKISSNTDFSTNEFLPEVTVYSTYLISVENSSKKTLEIIDMPAAPELSFKQVGNGAIIAENLKATKIKAKIATGNGSITLLGECDEAVLEMVGTGRINADMLEALYVNCKVFGTGSIGCWPIEKLNVKGLASTTVYYKGVPAEIKKTGAAKIEPMP